MLAPCGPRLALGSGGIADRKSLETPPFSGFKGDAQAIDVILMGTVSAGFLALALGDGSGIIRKEGERSVMAEMRAYDGWSQLVWIWSSSVWMAARTCAGVYVGCSPKINAATPESIDRILMLDADAHLRIHAGPQIAFGIGQFDFR